MQDTHSLMDIESEDNRRVLIRLKGDDGTEYGGTLDVSVTTSINDLDSICRMYGNSNETNYNFFIKDLEITYSLKQAINLLRLNIEFVIEITCRPKSSLNIRSVTRCTSSLPGHTASIVSIAFSPDGRNLASGSGDTTIRLWDINTETPFKVLEGHKDWVLVVSWSPTCDLLATGDKTGVIIIWNAYNGHPKFSPLKGHKKWITHICWEPLHLYFSTDKRYKSDQRFASSSKDGSIIVWSSQSGKNLRTLNGHLQSVTCVKWSGSGLIYTSSHDLTINVWTEEVFYYLTFEKLPTQNIKRACTLGVNFLALNSDYVIGSSCFETESSSIISPQSIPIEELSHIAYQRYNNYHMNHQEMMVSCSDDNTMILWNLSDIKISSTKLCGHRAPINHVKFSPDCRMIASASFDKSIKLWNGKTGKFIASLLGHINKVYQISWSSDSALLCSASSDSTLKVWNVTTKTLQHDLPGHLDEIYSLDWSYDGQKVASGGKDTILKIWRACD